MRDLKFHPCKFLFFFPCSFAQLLEKATLLWNQVEDKSEWVAISDKDRERYNTEMEKYRAVIVEAKSARKSKRNEAKKSRAAAKQFLESDLDDDDADFDPSKDLSSSEESSCDERIKEKKLKKKSSQKPSKQGDISFTILNIY